MDKVINLNKTVTELINEEPELQEPLARMGIKGAKGLKLIGRSRSLKEEADRRNILPEELIKKLREYGFEAVDRDVDEDVYDEEESEDESASYEKSLEEERVAMAQKQAALVASELALMAGGEIQELPEERIEMLSRYVRHACAGQNVRKIRKEIARELGNVTPQEIEQTAHLLLSDGVDYKKVESFCDVDSPLFRGNIDKDAPKSVKQALEAEKLLMREETDESLARLTAGKSINDLLEEAVAGDLAESGKDVPAGVLHFENGDITFGQLQAMIRILPMDITFIDENDICCFSVQGTNVLGRDDAKIGQSVYERHAKNVRPIIRALLNDFREGKQESAETWTPDREHPACVRFYAVRDKNGRYLGACEIAEDMSGAKEHFLK
uniref:DUF438 domain-containing protein n=1 Tax=Eubacterium cellulosolvens TaxID=29322 RepID=UPI000489A5E9|nr:DUF438 domain-containing protein [[Eubacterium] cellulosolvens]